MIRVLVPIEIQPGRGVRPIRPLLSWEVKPGTRIELPPEIESNLVREGFAEQVGEPKDK